VGLFTAGGVLVWKQGLNPLVRSAFAEIPTGLPPSPLFGVQPFTQPMPRFDVLRRLPMSAANPVPTKAANTTLQTVPAILGGGMGPIEGRPPGDIWAHQNFDTMPPKVFVEVSQEGAKSNTTYNPQVPSSLNSGINPSTSIPLRFHPALPTQGPDAVWTFNGNIPPALLLGRYMEPILFRHHNKLPTT
jgi:manganese oxidase